MLAFMYLEVDGKVKHKRPESHAHKDVNAQEGDDVMVLPEVRGYNGILSVLGFDPQEH